jgi:hypothetical protein
MVIWKKKDTKYIYLNFMSAENGIDFGNPRELETAYREKLASQSKEARKARERLKKMPTLRQLGGQLTAMRRKLERGDIAPQSYIETEGKLTQKRSEVSNLRKLAGLPQKKYVEFDTEKGRLLIRKGRAGKSPDFFGISRRFAKRPEIPVEPETKQKSMFDPERLVNLAVLYKKIFSAIREPNERMLDFVEAADDVFRQMGMGQDAEKTVLVDINEGRFKGEIKYTTTLSFFVKMSQMVQDVEGGNSGFKKMKQYVLNRISEVSRGMASDAAPVADEYFIKSLSQIHDPNIDFFSKFDYKYYEAYIRMYETSK